MAHIYGLSATIAATLEGGVAEAANRDKMTYEFLREETLVNLERAVIALDEAEDFSDLSVKIVRPDQTYEFEFWHLTGAGAAATGAACSSCLGAVGTFSPLVQTT